MEESKLQLVAKAKRDYISGLGSIAQIADRYGLNAGALSNRATDEGWRQERDAKLSLAPIGDFQAGLIRWKSKSTELLEKFEEKVVEGVKNVDTKNPWALNQLSCAIERTINSFREVGGIPRLAPLKAPDKSEKQIPAETSPIESQVSDNQSDTQ